MSNNTKIILGVIAGLLILCLGAGVVTMLGTGLFFRNVVRTVEQNPAEFSVDVDRVVEVEPGEVRVNSDDDVAPAEEITMFDLPEGFHQGTTMEIGDFTFVEYTGEDNHSHVIFMQVPATVHVDEDEMRRQMRMAMSNSEDGDVVVIDQRDVVIAGEETVLTIAEGRNNDGDSYRSATAMFQGRGGTAMVVIEMPEDSWDEQAVEQFLDSIQP